MVMAEPRAGSRGGCIGNYCIGLPCHSREGGKILNNKMRTI